MTSDLAVRLKYSDSVNAKVRYEPRCDDLPSLLAAAGESIMNERFETRDEWDAGDMGCGELVMELRRKLRQMPGEVLKIIALDPAAPIDLAAWCRMTSNELVACDIPNKSFWIKSRMVWN